jgi:hypothetical protein
MRLLVCGGRDFAGDSFLIRSLDSVHQRKPVSIVIHGGATGADHYAELWAIARNIHYARVPALWAGLGRSAGPKRNEAMLLLAPDAVVAFPGGRGTAHMVSIARDAGIQVWEPTP